MSKRYYVQLGPYFSTTVEAEGEYAAFDLAIQAFREFMVDGDEFSIEEEEEAAVAVAGEAE